MTLEIEEVEFALPWRELRREAETGVWTVARDRAALATLPVVAPDGQLVEGL